MRQFRRWQSWKQESWFLFQPAASLEEAFRELGFHSSTHEVEQRAFPLLKFWLRIGKRHYKYKTKCVLLFCLSPGDQAWLTQWSDNVSGKSADVKSLLFQFWVNQDFQDTANHINTWQKYGNWVSWGCPWKPASGSAVSERWTVKQCSKPRRAWLQSKKTLISWNLFCVLYPTYCS